MTPESVDPLLYLSKSSAREVEQPRMPIFTHVVAKKAAITSKRSILLFEVSPNPRISMRFTSLLSRVNLSEGRTSAVEFIPICRFEPLARLIN